MDLSTLLPDVHRYLRTAPLEVPGWDRDRPYDIVALAQGEYNLNYCVQQSGHAWVLRINCGSQMDLDHQILYEYRALQLLADSGVTPVPYDVDESEAYLNHGVLAMAYLPGGPLDYRRDLADAARLFARIHTIDVPEDHSLIVESQPLTMTYQECARLLPVYFESDLADPDLRDYLIDVLAWAAEARHREQYFVDDPWYCIINTEVNSSNFIANRDEGTLHLVDWEKPLYGDPSQDLSHFCAPMTTLWKSDYRMSSTVKYHFIDTYRSHFPDAHLRATIFERVRLRDPFNYLRGISWSAMAWVTYQTDVHAIQNSDTFQTISSYLDLAFQRDLFDPFLTGRRAY